MLKRKKKVRKVFAHSEQQKWEKKVYSMHESLCQIFKSDF